MLGSLFTACAAPRPSLEPLGGVSELGPKPRRDNRQARANASEGTTKANSDGGKVESETTKDDDEATVTVIPVDEAAKDGTKSETPPAAVAGDYVGEDVAVYKVDGMPDRTERDPKARTTVKEGKDAAIDIVIVDSSNGKDICSLAATRTGSTAVIRAGQKCFEQDSAGASTSASVKTGTAKFEGVRLIVEMDMAFELRVAGRAVSGSLDYRFDGTKR